MLNKAEIKERKEQNVFAQTDLFNRRKYAVYVINIFKRAFPLD